MTCMKRKKPHIIGAVYKADQNTLESVPPSCYCLRSFSYASGSPSNAFNCSAFFDWSLSYLHCSFPNSSISLHHRRLTSNLPVTFCTVQKSIAAKRTIITNDMISCPKKAFRNTKDRIDAPLKTTWNMQATGLRAVENKLERISVCSNYSEEID